MSNQREIETAVRPVRIEMSCPRCDDGRMAVLPESNMKANGFYHKCTACGVLEWLPEAYPQIRWKEEGDDSA